MWNDQRVTHLYPAAKASLGIDGCFGGFCHLLHYLRNQLMFLHHVQRLALEETRHAAEPAPRGSTGRFVTAAKSWANRLQLHSFGMVHVEVIESLWRYSWIPQTWPQVDLRKKHISISFWGIWCSNKPAWNRRKLLFAKTPYEESSWPSFAGPHVCFALLELKIFRNSRHRTLKPTSNKWFRI